MLSSADEKVTNSWHYQFVPFRLILFAGHFGLCLPALSGSIVEEECFCAYTHLPI